MVLVTNEGNATLTTTLPKVHVAISGIEKIVPTLEDVATLMRLLPRSSTGQSISNYVDILTGTKGAGEFHGAEHMYFIIVDSGRTAVLGSNVRDALRCIRCGACMNHCPVYQNVGGHSYGWVYPGPIGSILTPMYVGLENAQDLPAASTMCNQCGVVCPVRIPLPDLQRKLREKAYRGRAAALVRANRAQDLGMGRAAARTLRRGDEDRRAGVETMGRSRRNDSQASRWSRLDRGPRHAGAGRSDVPRALSREGQDVSAAGPSQGANHSPSGGSAAAVAASVGAHMSAAGPPQGANCSPSGGSAAAVAASVGAHQ